MIWQKITNWISDDCPNIFELTLNAHAMILDYQSSKTGTNENHMQSVKARDNDDF